MDYFWEVKFAGDVFSDVKIQSIFSWIFQPKQRSTDSQLCEFFLCFEANFHLNKLMETQFCGILHRTG